MCSIESQPGNLRLRRWVECCVLVCSRKFWSVPLLHGTWSSVTRSQHNSVLLKSGTMAINPKERMNGFNGLNGPKPLFCSLAFPSASKRVGWTAGSSSCPSRDPGGTGKAGPWWQSLGIKYWICLYQLCDLGHFSYVTCNFFHLWKGDNNSWLLGLRIK